MDADEKRKMDMWYFRGKHNAIKQLREVFGSGDPDKTFTVAEMNEFLDMFEQGVIGTGWDSREEDGES